MDETYFDGIIGHQNIKKKLVKTIVSGRIPHALIFAGPSGIGKSLMAVALASALVGRPVLQSLDERIDEPIIADQDDAFYLAPIGSMLRVDQFRQLQGQLMLRAREGQRRICIIDHVETMNTEFANRMLKILEEPPVGVTFILITDQPALLLPTIISRCITIPFEPVGDAEMTAGLMALKGGTAGDYAKAVAWGGGIVRTALDYVDGNTHDEAQAAFDFLQIMATHSCPYAKWLSVSIDFDDSKSKDILRWLALILRDLAMLRSGADSFVRLKEYTERMQDLLPYWSYGAIEDGLAVIADGREALTRHVNVRLVWDYVCIRFIRKKEVSS